MDEQHHRRSDYSPILIGTIGIVAGAILVATYHYIAAHCCSYTRSRNSSTNVQQNSENYRDGTASRTSQPRNVELPVSTYSKEFREATCSVCLSDFNEGDPIRVLPECSHLYHVPCIDAWLNSHPNCPLCRANTKHPQQTVLSLPSSASIPPREILQVAGS